MQSLSPVSKTCMQFFFKSLTRGEGSKKIQMRVKNVGWSRLLRHTCPPAHSPTHISLQTVRQAGRPILWAELSAWCWEGLVACMPVASWWESRKTCCCFRGRWPVCHLFQGNQRLQEISPVENTHRDNDGKRQQSENVRLKWKPRCQVLIMSFLNKPTSHIV